MEVLGLPPSNLLAVSQRKELLFKDTNCTQLSKETKHRKPGTKCLEDILGTSEKSASFIDFVEVSLF